MLHATGETVTRQGLLCAANSARATRHWTVAASPLECIHLAVEHGWDAVAVAFEGLDRRGREEALELCRLLRAGRRTRALPLTVLLPEPSRETLEALDDAGVANVLLGVRGKDIDGLHPGVLDKLPGGKTPADLLRRICPFAQARSMENGSHLHVCGAYRGRMVLGGRRLAASCHGGGFRECRYYQHPRTATGDDEA